MKYFFLSLIFITNLYSQSSGIVKYKFYIPVKIDENASVDTKELLKKTMNYANQQEFVLTFNKLQSKFNYIDNLSFESDYERKINNIARLAFTSKDTYSDFQKKIQIIILNDGALIEGKIENLNWEITTDSKTIGDYLCYKAILKTHYINRKGEDKIYESVCWFAPSLPYSYGPKNFYGLPGLILELTENDKTFIASKIELLNKEVKIDFPKGKTITKEEHEKGLKAQMGAYIKS